MGSRLSNLETLEAKLKIPSFPTPGWVWSFGGRFLRVFKPNQTDELEHSKLDRLRKLLSAALFVMLNQFSSLPPEQVPCQAHRRTGQRPSAEVQTGEGVGTCVNGPKQWRGGVQLPNRMLGTKGMRVLSQQTGETLETGRPSGLWDELAPPGNPAASGPASPCRLSVTVHFPEGAQEGSDEWPHQVGHYQGAKW